MGLYARHVLPRLTNRIMDVAEFAEIRRRVTADLAGTVLEVGFGSGLNVAHYPAGVNRVLAVEPSTVAHKLAAERVAGSPVGIEFVGLDGQEIRLDTESADHALSTWTLCTIPRVDRALAEIRRVLRPGGTLHFVEHGLSPAPAVARWQHRFNPIQGRLFGGCHLNRPIDQLVARSGLSMIAMTNYYAAGPKMFGYMYEGIARKD